MKHYLFWAGVWGLIALGCTRPASPGDRDFTQILEPRPFLESDQLPRNTGKDLLIVLFRDTDCSLCLFEVEFWQQASWANEDHLAVVGITDSNDSAFMKEIVEANAITFEIIQDASLFEQVRHYLKEAGLPRATPLKLYVDQANRLIGVETATKDMEQQERFPQRVAALLENRS